MSSKRQRIDTASGMAQIMQEAQITIEPPTHIHLPEDCRPHWLAITANRVPSLWNTADLELAATLARVKRDIESNYRALAVEGDLVEGKFGPAINPRHKLLEDLTRRAIALSRMLKIHAEATIGKSENLPGKNRALAEARSTLAGTPHGDAGDDDLLPGVGGYN